MGQGQEVPARRLMNQMMNQGGWVLLQNCHLSLDYIVELMDQIVEQENVNEQFRIFVTTEPHPKFPITFLQVSPSRDNTQPPCTYSRNPANLFLFFRSQAPFSRFVVFSISDVDQVHERASAGHQGGAEAHVRQHHAGLPRHLQHAPVEAHAVRRRLPPHLCAGEKCHRNESSILRQQQGIVVLCAFRQVFAAQLTSLNTTLVPWCFVVAAHTLFHNNGKKRHNFFFQWNKSWQTCYNSNQQHKHHPNFSQGNDNLQLHIRSAAGAAQVWAVGLEHPVRVQHGRLQRERAIRAEPPRRHGPQKGARPVKSSEKPSKKIKASEIFHLNAASRT